MKRSWFFIALPCFFWISCEKKIDFRPATATSAPVVEAYIETGTPPVVILSKSVNYFSKISPELLASTFIRDADVRISNGNVTHRLKEYMVPGQDGYTLYYYSIDSQSLATAFVGEEKREYHLTFQYEGKPYEATTTIPSLTKRMDSLWWEPVPSSTGPDTRVKLMARITDPPGYGNYIRYFTSVNRKPFYPGLASVFDDQIINGKTYTVQIDQGIDRNQDIDRENFNFFQRGDTITVKFCNIDKATFDFWRTIEYGYTSIGNPFSAPTKVIGNIKGGALGYFGGYAVQYRSLIVPK